MPSTRPQSHAPPCPAAEEVGGSGARDILSAALPARGAMDATIFYGAHHNIDTNYDVLDEVLVFEPSPTQPLRQLSPDELRRDPRASPSSPHEVRPSVSPLSQPPQTRDDWIERRSHHPRRRDRCVQDSSANAGARPPAATVVEHPSAVPLLGDCSTGSSPRTPGAETAPMGCELGEMATLAESPRHCPLLSEDPVKDGGAHMPPSIGRCAPEQEGGVASEPQEGSVAQVVECAHSAAPNRKRARLRLVAPARTTEQSREEAPETGRTLRLARMVTAADGAPTVATSDGSQALAPACTVSDGPVNGNGVAAPSLPSAPLATAVPDKPMPRAPNGVTPAPLQNDPIPSAVSPTKSPYSPLVRCIGEPFAMASAASTGKRMRACDWQSSLTPTPLYSSGGTPRRRHSKIGVPLPAGPEPVDFTGVRHTLEDTYILGRKISEGTYGEVHMAEVKETKEVVAVKRLKTLRGLDGFPITSLREVTALLHINRQRRKYQERHTGATRMPPLLENIVVLRDVLLSREASHDVFLVFEYAQHSMAGLLSQHFPFTEQDMAYLFRRIVLGVAQLHDMGIIHRDIKADNVLLTADGAVLLADFGLCVFEGSGRRAVTPNMINLSYRPPEMLLGSTMYDDKVDVWSIGCLLAQVFLGVPPFFKRRADEGERGKHAKDHRSAETELEQLSCIAEVLGPLHTVPADTFHPDTCRHLRHLQQLRDSFQQSSRAWGTRTEAPGPPCPAKLQALFQPSFVFSQFHGFRGWFVAAVENRRARCALERHIPTSTGRPRPPPLTPSPACLDVLCAIFQLQPGARPSAAQLLQMPFFQISEGQAFTAALVRTVEEREAYVRRELALKLSLCPDAHINIPPRR